MKTDREIAYEQNVSALEIAWADRIASFAREAVEKLLADEYADYEGDSDGLQFEASEIVTARLLDSLHWENVKATDASDIAYEAVGRAIESR